MDISALTSKELERIQLIVFDVDGVIVPRGTQIETSDDEVWYKVKRVADEQIEQIRSLAEQYHVNISSGRGLTMLQHMFRPVLDSVSLTFENGSATWIEGAVYQHSNSFSELKSLYPKLSGLEHEHFKGFEPKAFIITIHAHDRIPEVEELLADHDELYCLWNGEAYDIGLKRAQTKGVGVEALTELLGLTQDAVLAIGDNLNDKELLEAAGVSVTADETRVAGDYAIPLEGDGLPAGRLMSHILETRRAART